MVLDLKKDKYKFMYNFKKMIVYFKIKSILTCEMFLADNTLLNKDRIRTEFENLYRCYLWLFLKFSI